MSQEPTESQEPTLILTSQDKPFTKQGGAESALKQKGLEETHEVVPFGDGFAIAPKGDDAESEEEKDVVQDELLKNEPEQTKPTEKPEKKVPAKTEEKVSTPNKPKTKSLDEMTLAELERAVAKRKASGEQGGLEKADYYWVIFHAKSAPEQQDDVELHLNGNTLVFKREEEAVIPVEFMEVADQSITQKFKQVQGKGRKMTAKVKTFPYSVLRTATKKEYLELKRQGDAKTKKNIAEYGMNRPPEE